MLLDLHVEGGRMTRYEQGSTYAGKSPTVREQVTTGTTEEIRYQWYEAPE